MKGEYGVMPWLNPDPKIGKLWKTTSTGKKAVQIITGKKTFGDQIAALAADEMLKPGKWGAFPKKDSQAYANQMTYRFLLEWLLTEYEQFTDKNGKRWDLTPDEWTELNCILTAPLAGAYDDSMVKWYAFKGASLSNVCKLASNKPSLTWNSNKPRDFDWALSHVAARDPKAAVVIRQAFEGKMVERADEAAEAQAKAFEKGVKETIGDVAKAPFKAVDFLIPDWLKVVAVVGGIAYVYVLFKGNPLTRLVKK